MQRHKAREWGSLDRRLRRELGAVLGGIGTENAMLELGRRRAVAAILAGEAPSAVFQGEALGNLRLLPDESVDLVCADSPYSSGGFTRGDRNADPAQKYSNSDSPDGRGEGRISFTGDNRDGRSWCYWSALWLSEVRRVLKPGGYALSFSDWRMLPLATDAFQAGGLVWRGLISWDKGESARAPHTGYFRHQCEYVVWGSKGPLPKAQHGGPFPGYFAVSVKQSDKWHITGKPVELMRELVQCVPRGAIVLDPFAGSGTTLVACELEGRRSLGFELEPENVRIAMERLEGARTGVDSRAKLDGQLPIFGAP